MLIGIFSFRFWVKKKKRRHGLEASSMDNLNSLLKSKHGTPASKALRLIKYFFHLVTKDLFSILRPPGKSKPYFQLITWFNTIPQVLNNSIFEKLSTGKKNYNIDFVFLYIRAAKGVLIKECRPQGYFFSPRGSCIQLTAAKLCSYCTSQDLKKKTITSTATTKQKQQFSEESKFYNINFAQIHLENLQLIITF